MEKMALNDIRDGRSFKNVACLLKSFKRQGDVYLLTLTDKQVSCNFAYIKTNLFSYEQMKAFVGKAVMISGLHEVGLADAVKERVKVKNIVLDEKGEQQQLLRELGAAIAEPLLDVYLETIEKYKGYVGKEVPAYRELLEVYFTPEHISRMRKYPATHIRQGSPYGGMLHATLAVTDMAYYNAMRYLNFGNGIYSFRNIESLNWDLLITGGLLHLAGNFLYFTDDGDTYRKNAVGVEQGFSLCRQQYILKLIAKHNIAMGEEDLAALLGVMSRLNEQHDGIKKCRQEASFLYNAYNVFLEMDSFDQEVSELLKKQGDEEILDYGFSEKLNCYISEREVMRKRKLLRPTENNEGGN